MKPMENIKGIVFDFNGVLLWDGHLQEAAWKSYAKKLRNEEFTGEEMKHHMHGVPNSGVLEYLLGHTLTEKELAEHSAAKEREYRQMCLDNPDEFKLSPGARDYLDHLKANKVPRTIATASGLDILKFSFEHLELAHWFNFENVAYDDGTIRGKPEPDIYLKAARNIQLDPAACAVIEDAHSGITAAYRAGIGHIIALGPKENHAELAALEGVKQTIVDFRELAKVGRP